MRSFTVVLVSEPNGADDSGTSAEGPHALIEAPCAICVPESVGAGDSSSSRNAAGSALELTKDLSSVSCVAESTGDDDGTSTVGARPAQFGDPCVLTCATESIGLMLFGSYPHSI